MLVLSRKSNQTLHIGDDIIVTIVRVRGDSVRIGIQAPSDVKIMRNELVAKIAAQLDASGSSDAASNGVSPEKASQSTSTQSANTRPTSKNVAKRVPKPAAQTKRSVAESAQDSLLDGDQNPDDGPMCSGPLAQFCKPQLRAVFASAS
jgi:carbon storage regulator CsrA